MEKKYHKNTIIAVSGDLENCIFRVVDGCVKLIVMNHNGDTDTTITYVHAGDYFGESALDGDPFEFDAMTTVPTTVEKIAISSIDTEQKCKILVQRNKAYIEKLKLLSKKSVYERLVTFIKSCNKMSHAEIASNIKSSREMVSMIMKQLIDGGYITINNDSYIINKQLPSTF